jgi:hypothetical protein
MDPKIPEFTERIAALLKEALEKGKPLPGNKCSEPNCKGTVVKKVAYLFQGRFGYRTPECNRCGKKYPCARDVLTVGEKEFVDKLNTPYGL